MKNVLKYITIWALGLLIVSCNNDDEVLNVPTPTASYSYEFVTNSPQLVSFTNTTENAESYEWDFGDGSEVSYEKHPSHAYASGGTYTVLLKAFNQDKESQLTQEITVFGTPNADFSYQADSATAFKINFHNLSQNTSTYIWDFGDGTGTSTEENPNHTYPSEGTYTVTLTSEGDGGSDITTMEIEVADLLPPYNNLYVVGDASPSGWNIGSPQAFTQDITNPFVFVFEGLLTPGDLKISTFNGDWCDGDWINPANNGDDLTGNGFIVTSGCDGPDNKWSVNTSSQGRYKITIDFLQNTISFEEQFPQYSGLYIVGDGSPSGWNIGSPDAFAQSEADAFEFTYQGSLSPGVVKISTFTGDWCDGDWINSPQDGYELTNTDYIITNGCDGPDNKWAVTSTTQGAYIITVNLHNETIKFELQ